jgi:ubiquitin carboxyl-terminal hydrolase L3
MAQVLDNPDVPKGRKAFVPLGTAPPTDGETLTNRSATENNPEVMTSLVHKLGLSPTLAFHDVWSIDDPEMLSFVPRPASALLLVFPVSNNYEQFRMQEDADKAVYEGKGEGEPVVWYKQTIRNACGLIGILHAVSNGGARNFVGTFFRVSTRSAPEVYAC